jgi:hypothetical protein
MAATISDHDETVTEREQEAAPEVASEVAPAADSEPEKATA